MEPNDEALVIACHRGDADAWDTLVDRYKRLIYAIARGAGLDQEQAADVLQRVFTILLEHIDEIEQPARIGAWLVATARREAWRMQRREQAVRNTSELSETVLATLVDKADLPDELILRLEAQHKVRMAVAALDERCRKLLTMLFLEPDAPSYSQIAATMGMREGAIGPTRARCLQKLRQLLLDEES